MSEPSAFIFDMDGVIVHSNPYHKIALKKFVSAHGRELSEQELIEKIYGRTNKEWLTNFFGKLPPEKLQQYAEEKEVIYRDLFRKDVRPIEGLIDFLDLLDKNRIPRAIATSAPPSNVDFTLNNTGTRRYFKTILDETFVSNSKPHPEIYLKAAAALQLAPAQCVVIEDSLSGVKAAKSAGCWVIGITTTHTPEELHETNLVINDFRGLDPNDLLKQVFAH